MGVAESWRTNSSRYILEGRKCEDCDILYFPKRNHCENCLGDLLSRYIFTGRGKILEFTRVDEGAAGFEHQVPYYYGLVELEEGVKVTTQIIKPYERELEVGMPVEMTFRIIRKSDDQNIIIYGYKAEPIE